MAIVFSFDRQNGGFYIHIEIDSICRGKGGD